MARSSLQSSDLGGGGWVLLAHSRRHILSCCLPQQTQEEGGSVPSQEGVRIKPSLVLCALLKDQTWTRILGPEIAPCPREPWNSAGSSQARASQRRRPLEPSVLALKWRPRTGCSEQKTPKLWQRQAWDPDKDFFAGRQFEKSLFQAHQGFPRECVFQRTPDMVTKPVEDHCTQVTAFPTLPLCSFLPTPSLLLLDSVLFETWPHVPEVGLKYNTQLTITCPTGGLMKKNLGRTEWKDVTNSYAPDRCDHENKNLVQYRAQDQHPSSSSGLSHVLRNIIKPL